MQNPVFPPISSLKSAQLSSFDLFYVNCLNQSIAHDRGDGEGVRS